MLFFFAGYQSIETMKCYANLNEIKIDLSVLPESAKIELLDFYRILIDKYHHKFCDAQNQNIFASEKKEDVLIGLFHRSK